MKSFMVCLVLFLQFCTLPVAAQLSDDEQVMIEAIYFESGVEPYQCKVMLGQTIMNRVNKKSWKDTVRGVVWQRKQFSYTHDGKPETMEYTTNTYKTSYGAANEVLYGNGEDISRGADHFINHNIADPNVDWYKSMEFIGRCGDHWFYKSNRR